MKVTEHVRCENESIDDLVALLQGRVFRVTRLVNSPLILDSHEIKPNVDGSLSTTF